MLSPGAALPPCRQERLCENKSYKATKGHQVLRESLRPRPLSLSCPAGQHPAHRRCDGPRELNVDRKRHKQQHIFDHHHRHDQAAVGALALCLLQHSNLRMGGQ